jgi:membrane-associated protein
MPALPDILHHLFDAPALVHAAGYAGLTAIVFIETGLFFGFFLPGDSVLVTAGLLASQGLPLNVYALGVLLTAAAIAGDNTNYWIGRLSGPRIFRREDSLLFKRHHLATAHAFYVRHGAATVVFCRFVPIVRTFAPLVAGAGCMDYRLFLAFSILGGTAWIWSMLFIGYFLGVHVPGVARHIELVIAIVILVSILPGLIGWWRGRRAAAPSRPPL